MELAILLLSLAALLALGVPVAFALAGSSLFTFFFLDIPPVVAMQRMAAGMNIFALMAIPFFVFAGDLMARSGIAVRLIQVAEGLFGRTRGGLGQVDVGASMLFGAVSGTSVASVSALGSTLMPMMRERGYDPEYGVNVTATSSILGLLLPPSHNMIIYAAAAGAGVSVGKLFLAGVVPGVLTGVALMIAAYVVAVRRGYPRGAFPGWRQFLVSAVMAIPGLMTAIIIVGGILSGVFTPTESSAIAVVYTIFAGALVYRSLGREGFLAAAQGAVQTTAMVMLIIGSASAFGWLLAGLEAPAKLTALITLASDNPIIVLLIINIILLVLGTFMDMAPLIIIMTPILLPIAAGLGVDPHHFGIIMILNLGIGLVTPPVGSVLFVSCAVGKVRVEDAIKTIWPFYLALLGALILVTFMPALSLALPEMLG